MSNRHSSEEKTRACSPDGLFAHDRSTTPKIRSASYAARRPDTPIVIGFLVSR
jgi:hypothetical protein